MPIFLALSLCFAFSLSLSSLHHNGDSMTMVPITISKQKKLKPKPEATNQRYHLLIFTHTPDARVVFFPLLHCIFLPCAVIIILQHNFFAFTLFHCQLIRTLLPSIYSISIIRCLFLLRLIAWLLDLVETEYARHSQRVVIICHLWK